MPTASRADAIGFPLLILCGFLLLLLPGCLAQPVYNLDDTSDLEVSIRSIVPPVFTPGKSSRFMLSMTNHSSRTLVFERLEVKLKANPEGYPNVHSLEGHWRYPLQPAIRVKSGKKFEIPLTPEPLEFPMGGLLPGKYQIVAVLYGRFISKPHLVRVDRPDLNHRNRIRR